LTVVKTQAKVIKIIRLEGWGGGKLKLTPEWVAGPGGKWGARRLFFFFSTVKAQVGAA
jgi:hypothetical protein